MPLSSEQYFGVKAMTQAINALPDNPTIIQSLGVFTPEHLTTTYVNIARKDQHLTLVSAVPRGAMGDSSKETRHAPQTFHTLHLPRHDIVLADDVQNVQAFLGQNKLETVASRINDKLVAMKTDIDYTREALMLGALLGSIKNADGSELVNLYQRFGLTRTTHILDAGESAEVGAGLDKILTAQNKKRGGDMSSGWAVLCSESLMQAIVYHKTTKEAYLRYQETKVYREGGTNIAFEYKGIKFIQYDHDFGNSLKIADNQGIILPLGTKQSFKEFLAPANYSETVNTLAMPYYAKREPMKFGKGWELEAQSNPLPMLLRPEVVATVKLA